MSHLINLSIYQYNYFPKSYFYTLIIDPTSQYYFDNLGSNKYIIKELVL